MNIRPFDAEPKAPSWMTLSFSLYTILVTFFISLFSMGVLQKEQFSFKEGSRSVKSSLTAQGTAQEDAASPSLSAPAGAKFDDDAFLQNIESRVTARKMPYGMQVRMRTAQLFEPGSDTVLPSAETLLRNLVIYSQQGEYPVGIEVYSDDGINAEESLALAFRRAVAVARAWEASGRTAPERLFPSGHGSHALVEQDDTRRREAMSGQTVVKFYYRQQR